MRRILLHLSAEAITNFSFVTIKFPRFILCFILAIACAGNGFAQTPQNDHKAGQNWSLEECINYAWEHNLQVKQAEINEYVAKNNLTQTKANLYPSVNGFVSHTYNYGRTIDPFTNTFANSAVLSDDFYISGSLTLFGGFQNEYMVKEYKASYAASQFDLQSNKNNLALLIASGYLQVLLDDELLAQATKQENITTQQVKRTSALVEAGSLAKSNLLDIQAQEASDEVNTINAQNALTLANLSLAQLLDIDSVNDFKIAKPELTIPTNATLDNPDDVFTKAITNQPDIQSAQLKYQSSEDSRLAAAGALYPKLSLAASAGTGYSGANEEITNTTVQGYSPVGITSGNEIVYIPNVVYSYRITPFNNQFNENFNKSIGFRLSIPIFNGLQSNVGYKNAKLNELYAYDTYLTTELNLRKNIQQAYADAEGALKKYYASEKSVSALTEAFNYTKAKFEAGTTTTLDYNTAENNLANAESNLSQAKYTYIFKLKVLDYYEGKPLKL